MKRRWLLLPLILSLLLIAATVGVVLLIVPINFSLTIPGAILPVRDLVVTAAESGTAIEVRSPGRVAAGDVLVRLNAETEERHLAETEVELAALESDLAHERERIAHELSARMLQLGLLSAQRRITEAELDYLLGDSAALDAEIRGKEAAENLVDDRLARSELDILKKLAEELSVPAMELAQGEARAEKAALQVSRAELLERKRTLDLDARVRGLRLELDRRDAEMRLADDHFPEERIARQLERQILQLQTRKADLEHTIRKKVCRAPWDGFWGTVAFEPGEYVALGAVLGSLYDDRNLAFEGRVTEDKFAWLHPGMDGYLRIGAYSFLKYGRLPATVMELEPRPRSMPPEFRVKLAVADADLPFEPTVGMTGLADVVVFRGTFLEYLLNEPGTVRTTRVGRLDRLRDKLSRFRLDEERFLPQEKPVEPAP